MPARGEIDHLAENCHEVNGNRAVVTDDVFLGGKLKLLQPRRGYRAGLDAVFLAAAAPVQFGACESVADLGAGVGTVGLCVAARIDDARIALLEREPDLVAMANKNVERNGLSTRVRVVAGDVLAAAGGLAEQGFGADQFDHALVNPPYYATGRGTEAANDLRARSHAMEEGALDQWARVLARVARPGGSVTVIYPASGLSRVLEAFGRRFGGLRILPLYSREEAPAHRVIVQGYKGSRAAQQLLPGMIVHHASGNGFTAQAEAILRRGARLDLGKV